MKSADWFYQDVASAVAAGYVTGYPDETFGPNNYITRQEVAVVISKLLGLKDNDKELVGSFTDAGGIENWSKASVYSVVNSKIMNGYPDGTFRPRDFITRAEATVVLDAAKNLNNKLIAPVTGGGGSSSGGGGGGSNRDNVAPTITITSPTNELTYDTRETAINLSGLASDNLGVMSVVYSVYNGASGQLAAGTINWSINNLDLLPGENKITITAEDAAGNTGTDTITINYDMGRVEPLNFQDVVVDPDTGLEVVRNQILVTFKENISEETVISKVDSINGEIVGYISGMNDYQIKINGNPTLQDLNAIISNLNADPDVEVAILNRVEQSEQLTPNQGNDPEWFNGNSADAWDENSPTGKNWGLEAIKAPSAWEYNGEMQKVKIGVMDVGFQINHEDLRVDPQNAQNTSAGGPMQVKDHGTHVAGTIGAISNNTTGITGIVWNRDMYFYRASLTDVSNEQFQKSQVFEYKYGIAWLLEHGSKAINISLGVNHRPNFHRVPSESNQSDIKTFMEEPRKYWTPFIKRLINNGYDFVLIQSAGNDSIDVKWNTFLCSIDDSEVRKRIILVGAIGKRGDLTDWLLGPYYYADFSNYGEKVDVAAPGVNIFSTISDNNYAGTGWSGTSMAAPHVTGVVAMVQAINPNLTGEQVKEIVVGTADRPITYKGRQYNIVNAQAAVERARSEQAAQPIERPINGVLIGRVLDAQTDQGLSGATISVFKGDSYETYYASTISETDGSYELILAPGQYKVFISKENYISTYSYKTITEGTVVYEATIRAVSEQDIGTGRVSGYITNAFDGTGVSGLTIDFREGINNATGIIAASTTTIDSQGYYETDLPAGNYTAVISGEGYALGYFFVVSIGNTLRPMQNGSVTPIIPDDQTRIILTWGATPSDLDSHLSGPTPDGERFHVYYGNDSYTVSNFVYDDLDIDDTSSYGPETTTIYTQIDGTYRFSIHDYSNRGSSNSQSLANSGATVRVYRGNVLVSTFNVPTNQGGTLWTVFEMNGNTITPINRMSYESNPSNIQTANSLFNPNDITTQQDDADLLRNLPSKD